MCVCVSVCVCVCVAIADRVGPEDGVSVMSPSPRGSSRRHDQSAFAQELDDLSGGRVVPAEMSVPSPSSGGTGSDSSDAWVLEQMENFGTVKVRLLSFHRRTGQMLSEKACVASGAPKVLLVVCRVLTYASCHFYRNRYMYAYFPGN